MKKQVLDIFQIDKNADYWRMKHDEVVRKANWFLWCIGFMSIPFVIGLVICFKLIIALSKGW